MNRSSPVDGAVLASMASRFPRTAFEEPRLILRANAGFAAAPLRSRGRLEEAWFLDSSDVDVCVADARIDNVEALSRRCGEEPPIERHSLLRRAFRALGEHAPARLRGDFSVVYWDEQERSLIAARDQFGVRPCYYSSHGDSIAVSNCLESVLAVPWVSRDLRDEVVAAFVLEGCVVVPSTTIYRDVFRLEPAHLLRFDETGLKIERFWRMPIVFATRRRALDDIVDEFGDAFRRAVARRVDGDVTIALSGGLDSTSIAAAAVEGRPVAARICGATLGNSSGSDDERDLAKLVSAHLGIDWLFVDFEKLPLWSGTVHGFPLAMPVGTPQFTRFVDLCMQSSTRSSVMLSGDGGDEILRAPQFPFAGSWEREGVYGVVRDIISAVKDARLIPRFGIRNFRQRGLALREVRPEWLILNSPMLGADARGEVGFSRNDEAAFRMERRRAWADMSSPQVSFMFELAHPCFTRCPVEFRYPFVDVDFVSAAIGLPGYPAFESKLLLRRMARGRLPDAILRRPKQGVSDQVLDRLAKGDAVEPKLKRYPVQGFFDVGKLLHDARTLSSLSTSRRWMCLRALEVLLWMDALSNR